MTNPMKVPVCRAVVVMPDAFGRALRATFQCEMTPDHDGPHSYAMTACEPRAELVWFSEGEMS